jgi:hypothetical protein
VHLGRQMIKQKGEGLVDRLSIKNMIVIKDEDKMIRDGGNLIEKRSHNGFSWRWLRGLEHTQQPFSNRGRNRLQRSDEVGQ